ncbi:hypothetical protein ACOCJ7_02065 [Knoellia sp. CPCC 206453]
MANPSRMKPTLEEQIEIAELNTGVRSTLESIKREAEGRAV